MNAELDKTMAFDESCAQEVVLTNPPVAVAREYEMEARRQTSSRGTLERLDWLLWLLCFCLGALFGHEWLPAIASWLR